ncbi:MAG: transketolase family protein [Desulfobacterales bacterium]|nr:MAG: transketolase family protein [Desulfobacterales bacterium]
MTEMIAQRVAFAQTLIELGRENEKIVVLDADLATSTLVDKFAEALPERFFEMGIAEQNMFGVAAGMATLGIIPFCSTFACFTAKRALDQIRVLIAQPKLNVKMIGAYSGILTGKTGKTHQSVEDIAVFRAMPHIVTIAPVDGREVALALRAMVDYQGPIYLRLTRDPCPVIVDDDYVFTIGKALLLRDGSDVTIIGTGEQSQRCLVAAEILAEQNIQAHVLHVPTIKPLDVEAIIAAGVKTGLVVTAEDHSIIGGLGGAVAEVLGEHNPLPIKRVGWPDIFGESGANDDLLDKYGLTPEQVAKAAMELLQRRRR